MYEINDTLSKLNKYILQLERNFFLYFVGKEKSAPTKEFELLKQEILILSKARDPQSTSTQFLVNSFIQRFTTYRTKWERSLRDIEEGRKRRSIEFFGKYTAKQMLSTVNNKDMTKMIDSVADEYVALATKYLHKSVNKEVIKQKLTSESKKLIKKYGDNFVLDTYYDGSDVKIRVMKTNGN
jgi:hypothetical protein